MQKLDDFIDGLLKTKGIVNLPEDVEKEVKGDMYSHLIKQINKSAILALPEQKAIELAEMMENGLSSAEVADFMEKAGVDFDQIIRETCEKFSNLYLKGEA